MVTMMIVVVVVVVKYIMGVLILCWIHSPIHILKKTEFLGR